MLAADMLDHIKALFLQEHRLNDHTQEMALFIRHVSEGRLHCEVWVYFSPATVNVAQAVDAIPCEYPSSVGLSLFAGEPESWLVLFPQDFNTLSGRATE